MLLQRLLDALVVTGTLTLIDAKGRRHSASGAPGPEVTLRLHDPALNRTLFFDPTLKAGEAYMDGTLTVEDGDIYDFLALAVLNLGHRELWSKHRLWRFLTRRIAQANSLARARHNIAHHYDLSDTLYDLFLDRDRQYSCAYYVSPEDSLESAQANKMRHIAAKLVLERESRVLDIGSGWGGLALYLAQVSGAHVTGVTLSSEQLEVAVARAKESALTERVEFRLQDYRDVTGRFDRIVSVGMFEHVGVGRYREFFAKARDLLADDGVMLLHTIGRSFGRGATNPWLRKYIFPGGYVPALSEVLPAIERSGLHVTDIETLRLHYAETVKAWRARFNANHGRIAEIYDERFCRMWEFYLAGCEANFRFGGIAVFQIQLSKRLDTVPLTRDYIAEWERAHAVRESARNPTADRSCRARAARAKFVSPAGQRDRRFRRVRFGTV